MIYGITLEAKKGAVENLLKKKGYENKEKNRWHKKGDFKGIYVFLEPTYVEEFMEKFSIRVSLPDTPKFENVMGRYGIKPGITGRNQNLKLNILENILNGLKS